MTKRRAWLQLNLAVALFGLSALLAVEMSAGSLVIVFGRSFFAFWSLTFLAPGLGRRPWLSQSPAGAGRLALAGLMLAAHWVAFIQAVLQGGVALATLGFASFPAFVTLIEACRTKTPPAPAEVLIIIIIFVGVALVTPSFNPAESSTSGLVWGVISGLLYAVIIVGNRYLVRGVSGFDSCWWQYLAAWVVLLPLAAGELPDISGRDWGLMLIMGLVSTALAFTLFVLALKWVRSGEAAVISAMEPVYAIAMAWLFLGQAPGLKMIAGGFLIVGAVVWSGLRSPR